MGYLNEVQLLLNYYADQHVKDLDGITPRDIAIKANNLDIVHLFVKAEGDGISIEPASTRFFVVRPESKKYAEELVDGILSKTEPNIHKTYTNEATFTDKFVASEKLLVRTRKSVNVQNNHGNSPLIEAANTENIDIIKLLLNRGAYIDIQNKQGSTALHIAISNKIFTNAELLLDAGADLNIVDQYNNTPLHLAIFFEHFHAAKLLLNKGASLNIPNFFGCTPLHFAIAKGDIKITQLLLAKEIVRLLLDNGVDINCQDNFGYTPLHLAIMKEDRNTVNMLLERGSNFNIIDKSGNTPLDTARLKALERITKELSKRETSTAVQFTGDYVIMHMHTLNNNFNIIKLLLQKGAISRSSGVQSNIDVVKVRLDQGTDTEGNLPSIYDALAISDENIIKVLMDKLNNVKNISETDSLIEEVSKRDENHTTPDRNSYPDVADNGGNDHLNNSPEGLDKFELHLNSDHDVAAFQRAICEGNIDIKGAISRSSGVQSNIDVVKVRLDQGTDTEGNLPSIYDALAISDENIIKVLMDKLNNVKNISETDSLIEEVSKRDENHTTPDRNSYPDVADNGGNDHLNNSPEGLDKFELHLNSDHDVAAFQRAICEGNIDIVESFLHSGMNVNIQFENGKTPLRLAASLIPIALQSFVQRTYVHIVLVIKTSFSVFFVSFLFEPYYPYPASVYWLSVQTPPRGDGCVLGESHGKPFHPRRNRPETVGELINADVNHVDQFDQWFPIL
ncbi:Ankyrin repeats (3 copies) [Popillia japonica]|uniref:Ankyrin repeats (3 copies) n=1 Tax=Popillia japonica TaxID=7064 RepID=A0AAW1KMI6_POPJA